MFQASVSISACIFYVFMNIYIGYVCINGHTAGGGGGGGGITDLPTLFFSSPLRQHNNFFFLPFVVHTDTHEQLLTIVSMKINQSE